jgi:hypothetical protein
MIHLASGDLELDDGISMSPCRSTKFDPNFADMVRGGMWEHEEHMKVGEGCAGTHRPCSSSAFRLVALLSLPYISIGGNHACLHHDLLARP